MYHGPVSYTWDNLTQPTSPEDVRDVHEKDGTAGDRGPMDPAHAGAEAENVPASLDVPWTSREVADDDEQQEADTLQGQQSTSW